MDLCSAEAKEASQGQLARGKLAERRVPHLRTMTLPPST